MKGVSAILLIEGLKTSMVLKFPIFDRNMAKIDDRSLAKILLRVFVWFSGGV